MAWIKSLLTITTLAATFSLGIVSILTLPTKVQAEKQQATFAEKYPNGWQISQTYAPPNRGAPPATLGGASRGACLDEKLLQSLMPANNLALTTQDYPTLYWYIPESTATSLELEVRYGQDQSTWQKKTFTVPIKPGVVSVNLQKSNLPPLKVGETYHWFFRMVCNNRNTTDSGDRSGDAIVEGWIERVEARDLAKKLENSALSDRPALYAEAGIWHDSLSTLAELIRTNPNDRTLTVKWEKLLNSAGLDELVDKPLVDCCTVSR